VAGRFSPLYSPVRGLSRLSGVLAKSSASATRLRDVLDSREQVTDRPDARPAPSITGDVRLADVRFSYQPGQPVLDDFDLTVQAGETVCLFGPSGIGKSTILHLLLRLYDVDAGAVLLDGVDVRDVDQHSLRRRIAFVPQEPWLFDASIADNIAIGHTLATRHGILRAARDALVDEFVDKLPDGYDTVVGEGATRPGPRRIVGCAAGAAGRTNCFARRACGRRGDHGDPTIHRRSHRPARHPRPRRRRARRPGRDSQKSGPVRQPQRRTVSHGEEVTS
jgi:ATP-binding cassette, subfamily B, bacterial